MIDVPTAYAQFGQTLAFTERSMSATLRDHLAERGVEPETWYALKLVSNGEAGVAPESLINDLAGSRGLTADRVAALLARLEADGLITGASTVQLTSRGREVFADLRDYILGATANLLGSVDLADIETTVRTLQAITKQTEQQRAS